ncbi:hypothetical protein CRV00_09435 [Malaciobacter molluscorum]|uniref:hypothetical protein n=1 Tax=Malaciobacter molluscorum TaxID=1032072 RepID=UPI00100B0FDA|nr:hypothetical protein [Malaciobacter molluscorum]RXJ93881.1 hypothetical protein CRV00_09435 [Malaciobacter molluscorum]
MIKNNIFHSSFKKVVITTFLITSSVSASTNDVKIDCNLKSESVFKTFCYEKEFKKGNYENADNLISGLSRNREDAKVKKYIDILNKNNKLNLIKYEYSLSRKNHEYLKELRVKNLDIEDIERNIKYNKDKRDLWYNRIINSKKYSKYVEFAEIINKTDPQKAKELIKIASKHNNAKAIYLSTTNKYALYLDEKQKKELLEKAAKLKNKEALLELFKKDYKWISSIKKLKDDDLVEFFLNNEKDLKYNDKKYFLNRFVKDGNAKGIYLKLKSIEMHEYGYNELISNITKKFSSTRFINSKVRYNLSKYKDDILKEYAKNNDIKATLYLSTKYGKTKNLLKPEEYILEKGSKKDIFLFAQQLASNRYQGSNESIKILEKLAKQNYAPAEELLMSLYLKEKIYKKYPKKVEALSNKLIKKDNLEALYYKIVKIGNPNNLDKLTTAQFKEVLKVANKMQSLGFVAARNIKKTIYSYILKNKKGSTLYNDIKKEVQEGIKNNDSFFKHFKYLL